MDDDYVFLRELDLQTNLPEMVVHLKKDRSLRRLEMAKKKELYDEFYTVVKMTSLSGDISDEEKHDIEIAAMKQMLERAGREMRNTLHQHIKSSRSITMDEYTFRREFDFASLFPETIVELKNSQWFRKMSLAEKNALYDNMYGVHKRYFLSKYVSAEEKARIVMERGLQELEKTLQ